VVVAANRVADPEGFALLLVVNVLGFVLAGLMWRRSRPRSPFGTLLVGFGFLLGFACLAGVSQPVLFDLGVLLDAPTVLFAWWLILSFPSGRLDRVGRGLLLIGAGVVLLGFIPKLLVSPSIRGSTPLAECTLPCPANRLLISDNPDLAAFFRGVEAYGRFTVVALILATLALRFLRASRPRRRVLSPVYLVWMIWLLAFGAYGLAVQVLHASTDFTHPLGLALTGARVLLPFAFVAAIVLARAYAGAALESMVRDLTGRTSAAGLERIVRSVLDDRSAQLAFWLPRAHVFADRHGRALAPAAPDSGSSQRIFGRADGAPVVAIVHDSALDEDYELVEAVGAASMLALENERLQQDLRRAVEDLQASRKRLVTVGALERRKIERDLHDSSQQQLVAIRIQLELVREQTGPDSAIASQLAEIAEELDRALDELRAVSQGIFPPLLEEEGLASALRQAMRRAAVAVKADIQEVGRLPEEVETAIYFCCLEALQNSAKHGGEDVVVSIRLWKEPHLVRFAIVDDGVGFVLSRNHNGTGLTNMSDRLGAIGGTISIRSAPGRGTYIDGAVKVTS
jgi:signal transduction histidine kinase